MKKYYYVVNAQSPIGKMLGSENSYDNGTEVISVAPEYGSDSLYTDIQEAF